MSGHFERRWTAVAVWLATVLSLLPSRAIAQSSPAASIDEVVATANGANITAADLEFQYLLHKTPPRDRAARRDALVQGLIDQKLMSQFLESKQVHANTAEIDSQVAAVKGLIERSGRKPEELLEKIGVSETVLRKTLELPFAWKTYVRQTVSEEQLAKYFEDHRRQFDGTRIRAAHIVLTSPPDWTEADRLTAESKLNDLRRKILAGELTFADAAKQHSQSPSAADGGDLGWIKDGSGVPAEIAEAAGTLKAGEISEPIVTRYGIHLVTVTEVRPGQFSLEDVRPELLKELGETMWREKLKELRGAAKIE